MDKAILNALLYKENITDVKKINDGTRKKLRKDLKSGKKAIIYGTGQIAEHFVEKYLKNVEICGYIDKAKAGKQFREKTVLGPEALSTLNPQEYVILIASTVYMNEIAHIFDTMPEFEIYSLVYMEGRRLKYRFVHKCLKIWLNCLHPVKKNKVLFLNCFENYTDNCKYVAEYFHRNYPKYRLYWAGRGENGYFPEYIIRIKDTRWQQLYHMATSKAVIYNDVQGYGFEKRKGQLFVQLWHADIPIKKVGIDAGTKGIKNYQDVENTARITDAFVTNGEIAAQIHRKAFLYEGEFINVSSPRLDGAINSDEKQKAQILKKFNLTGDEYIVIYAPTFREEEKIKNFIAPGALDRMDYAALKNKIEEKFRKKCVIMLRLHPRIREKSKEYADNENVIDISGYEDIYELLPCINMLITDYSSLMMDAGLAKKHVILYATDVENYIEKERGFYLDFRKLPFPICENTKELMAAIAEYDEELQRERLIEYNRDYLKRRPENGDNTKIVCEYIVDRIEGKKKK